MSLRMDKLTINCKGNVNKVVDEPEELLAQYLWDKDIEVTYIHHLTDVENHVILFYGFEMLEGLIGKILDRRRKDTLYDFFNKYDIEIVNVVHEICDDAEYMQFIDEDE